MPDIAMCLNEKCTKRLSCYRYTATPNGNSQNYSLFKQEKNGKCENYWEVKE